LITHVCKPPIATIVGQAEPAALSAAVGWGLAVAALAAGYVGYGWPGVLLGVSVIVFWLLLQFSRSVRVLRQAADRPVGHVPSAVMLGSKLHAGMRLPQVLALTRSLGTAVSKEPEIWSWRDEGGDELHLHFRDGRLEQWELRRAGA
jgi:hypothetical protein